MDAQEYDRIVDKLLQFRGKLPNYPLKMRSAKIKAANLRQLIMDLLTLIDEFAALDEKGWIK